MEPPITDTDAELLRRYAREGSEAAFAELVRRHLDMVYSAALRQVFGDTHRAQDVAQTAFTALARKARSLARHPSVVQSPKSLQASTGVLAPESEPFNARDFYERARQHEKAQRYRDAIADYSKAIELEPSFFDAYSFRAGIFHRRLPLAERDYTRALADYTRCLEINPRDWGARHNRALCNQQLGNYDTAHADYTTIIEGDTDFSNFMGGKNEAVVVARAYRGHLLQDRRGNPGAAIADYTAALALDPTNKDLNLNYHRGRAYQALKRYDLAEADFSAAYEITPDYPNLLAAYAWQLATASDARYRDGKAALQMALRANEKFRVQHATNVDVLAAVYAENGRFDEAVATQQRAIALAKRPFELKLVPAMQARLTLYHQKQPYREP